MSLGTNDRRVLTLLILTASGIGGCGKDERATQIAIEAAAQQASQNAELAQLNREVAQGTRQLIESRGAADQQILDQQGALQRERDQLDGERREIAAQRNHESVLTAVLFTAGSLWVCSLPLILCWYLLLRLGAESAETQLSQLVVEQLADLSASMISATSQLTVPTTDRELMLSDQLDGDSQAS